MTRASEGLKNREQLEKWYDFYLCGVFVCYNLGLVRIKRLHIGMIPIMEKFLCISGANARPKKQNQLDKSQHRGVGVLM